MSYCNVEFRIDTFPSSEKFQIFKVYDNVIWQVMSHEAYNIDTGEIEYIDMVFDDMITAELIAEHLNEAWNDING